MNCDLFLSLFCNILKKSDNCSILSTKIHVGFFTLKKKKKRIVISSSLFSNACNVDIFSGISNVEELSTSQHVLCAWICGREAADMELCSDEEVVESITRVLRQFTGDPTLPYPANLLRSKWCMDQYFSGSYSYMGLESTVGHQCDLASPLPGVFQTFFSFSFKNNNNICSSFLPLSNFFHLCRYVRTYTSDTFIRWRSNNSRTLQHSTWG